MTSGTLCAALKRWNEVGSMRVGINPLQKMDFVCMAGPLLLGTNWNTTEAGPKSVDMIEVDVRTSSNTVIGPGNTTGSICMR